MANSGILSEEAFYLKLCLMKKDQVKYVFRNDSRTYYGLIRFEHSKDNPYKHEKLVEKVMQDKEFREKYMAQETKYVWLNNWK